ncbi:MAG: rod shape-determining protein MreC [Candidatus Jorgensenbacteria bacterium]|nr:rod shape-determining protein MreC [Candidatus Jorgensenbacteria bacterium]
MKTLRGFFKAFILIAFFVAMFFFRNNMTGAFSGARGFFVSFFHSADYRTFVDMRLENASLKKAVERLSAIEASKKADLLEARIYSQYPFSYKNIIVVDKGSADGVSIGMPVLVKENILLGKVKKVGKFQSEVITIFDPDWKSSVSIGDGKIKAVFHGANTPIAELIPKDALIKSGDNVQNITKELPLGLSMGLISSTSTDEKKVWQIGNIETDFSIEDISSVFIMTNFN